MVFVHVWQVQMEEKYWLSEDPKEGKSLACQMKNWIKDRNPHNTLFNDIYKRDNRTIVSFFYSLHNNFTKK